MDKLIAGIIALLLLYGNFGYIIGIIKGTVIPTKSSWMIFSLVTCLNVASFLTNKFDLISGAYGITDCLACLMVLATTLICARKEKMVFQRFEKYYLLAVAVCLTFWFLSKSSFYTNLLAQLLIIIGYLPIIHSMLVTRRSTESKKAWTIWLVAMILSFYPAIANHNLLALIYAGRGTIMCSLLLILIYKFSPKEKSPAQTLKPING